MGQNVWKSRRFYVVMLLLIMVLSVMPKEGVSAKSKSGKTAISKTKLTMVVKDKYTLKVTGTSKKVKWSSSKKSVAAVSGKGRITAKKAGKAVITAKVNGKKYRCKVTVKKSAQISKKKATISTKDKLTLKLKNTVSKPKWSSKNKKVATVNKNGVVKPVKKGVANIVASLRGKKYVCRVTVVDSSKDTDDAKDKGLLINGEKPKDFSLDLFAMTQSYQKALTIPNHCRQSFQITVTGNKNKPEFKVVSGNSVTVDENGGIRPKEEITYWNGNIGYSYPTGAQGERKEVSYQYGTSVVQIKVDGRTYKATVTLKNYAVVYADEKLDTFIKEKITVGMKQIDKLRAITEYVAHTYHYSEKYSGYVSMAVFGGGDCWASTSMILELCERTGIKARLHYVDGNAWGGHRNVVALADGEVYEADAGYTGNAPRHYSVSKMEKGFGYRISAGKAYISEYEGFDTVVRIPDMLGGYPVAGIETNTFYGCIVYGKLNVTKIFVPATVETISPQAFCGGETKITGVTVASDNPNYCDVEGIVYTKDKTKLCYVPPVKAGILTVDLNVTEIEDYAVSYCTKITKVVLGDKVQRIGMAAFWNCTQMTEINLPAGMTTLGTGVFASSSLLNVEVPESITELPDGAFQYCSKLKITVKNPDTVIGEQAITKGAVILGYENSTAQEYAEKNNITFIKIEQ